MSTITTINASDQISSSRADINTNFSNLNTDKVEGPSSSVDSEVALFSGTGGKTVKRATGTGVIKVTSGVASVASVVETDLGFTDIATGNASSSAHGLLPKTPANSTQFLNGGTGPAFASVKDSDLSLSDIATNNAGTGAHGFMQKLKGSSTQFFRSDGTFASPAGNTFANGTTTKNSADASTTQNIAHGLGVIPKYIRITGNGGSTTNNGRFHVAYNGTTQSSQSVYFESASATIDNTFTLNIAGVAGTQVGVVTFDATNIIITWTKTNSPTGIYQLLWEAIG